MALTLSTIESACFLSDWHVVVIDHTHMCVHHSLSLCTDVHGHTDSTDSSEDVLTYRFMPVSPQKKIALAPRNVAPFIVYTCMCVLC